MVSKLAKPNQHCIWRDRKVCRALSYQSLDAIRPISLVSFGLGLCSKIGSRIEVPKGNLFQNLISSNCQDILSKVSEHPLQILFLISASKPIDCMRMGTEIHFEINGLHVAILALRKLLDGPTHATGSRSMTNSVAEGIDIFHAALPIRYLGLSSRT